MSCTARFARQTLAPSSRSATIVNSPAKVLAAGVAGMIVATSAPQDARAAGVSGYLPLNIEPEMERQVERVLILADEPVLKRPFAVALVLDALPKACERDKPLCERVRRYLDRYSRDYAVTYASVAGAANRGADVTLPNSYGMPAASHYDVAAQGFVQPSDYFLVSAGVDAYQGRTLPTGSMMSMGFNGAQLDIGYRPHWFSPMTDSTMLISTEAPTMPSATLSNYEPLTSWGFQYEVFLARMSSTDRIAFQGQGTSELSRGNPHLFGTQLTFEPVSGWSIGVNRQLQYGGGGLPDSAHFLLNDFLHPAGTNQTLNKQQASYMSRVIIPASTPFAVYAQYSGQNTLNGGSYLLGESALAMGIDFPRLWRNFDLTYEITEWQNGWYASNGVFLDGMTQNRLPTGQWAASERLFGDGVGARAQMLRLGWEPPFGGYLEGRVRTVANQVYGQYPYTHYVEIMTRYSRPWKDLTVGGEVAAGHDAFGQSFSRINGFVRYGRDGHDRSAEAADEPAGDSAPDEASSSAPEEDRRALELFVDMGVNVDKVRTDLEKGLPTTWSGVGASPHLAVGGRRAVSTWNDLGARIEFDEVQGHSLIGVRALDFRHRMNEHFAINLFAGVDRYDLATPAYSIDFGAGVAWRDILPKWDLNFDLRHGQNVARNHVLPTDVQGVRPDSFYKIEQMLLYLSRKF